MSPSASSSTKPRPSVLKQIKLSDSFTASKRANSLSSTSKAAKKKGLVRQRRAATTTTGAAADEIEDSDAGDEAPSTTIFKMINRPATIEDTPMVLDEALIGLGDLRDKKGLLNEYYVAVRQRMGNMDPIHGKGETKIHHILRVFDLSYEYGPCIGVSRLDRWERAYNMGLNPPEEVRLILETPEAMAKEEYSQNVYFKYDSGRDAPTSAN